MTPEPSDSDTPAATRPVGSTGARRHIRLTSHSGGFGALPIVWGAVDHLKEVRPRSVKFVYLLSCPEGLKAMADAHADVPICTAAIDGQLNKHAYILPGLGDAGDRIFGTK